MYPANLVKGSQRTAFWLALFVTAFFYYWTGRQIAPLTGKEIVSFETARQPELANSLLLQWKEYGAKKEKLQTSIYLDYGFIFLYVTTIALGSRFLSALTRNSILKKAGRFFSWLILIAGGCDVIENILMTQSIASGATSGTTFWTYYMAFTKFSIVLICLLFTLFCLIMYGLGLLAKKED
jgi:hypothetical protein